jgi:hypothetical protein
VLPRAKRDVQHADVQLLTILGRVDPKTLGVEELPALAQRHYHTRGGAEGSGHDRAYLRCRITVGGLLQTVADEKL